ncbi:hypothetical protein ACGF7U_28495 [Micromonospora sp. NPDC047670]|uniref:hypothetical protein n=1 Tax=Micromonospora sp. NPDC047670 TaxID=3364252 RepID=UPI0037167F6B
MIDALGPGGLRSGVAVLAAYQPGRMNSSLTDSWRGCSILPAQAQQVDYFG